MSLKETTVLRIKRKREESPINALVISFDVKKKKVEDLGTDTKNFFTLAGTIEEEDDTSEIIDKIKEGRTPLKNYTNDVKLQNRKKTKENQKIARFKILSKKRDNSDPKIDYDFVDAIPDETVSYQVEEDELLCNSEKMIREKLNISDVQSKNSEDFVYDLYFVPNTVLNADSEMLRIEEYIEDNYLEDENNAEYEYYDDEDDENAEDNWRNDYPEEDDFNSSENENFSDNSSDDDDDEENMNRYRVGKNRFTFDPYAQDDNEYYNALSSDEET